MSDIKSLDQASKKILELIKKAIDKEISFFTVQAVGAVLKAHPDWSVEYAAEYLLKWVKQNELVADPS